MALNVAWSNGQLYLGLGETILTSYENVDMKLTGGSLRSLKANGRVYLTQYRIIFVSSKSSNMSSFSMPFHLLRELEIKQPLFGANYLQGQITAENNGGWQGRAEFTLAFLSGGGIEFSSFLLRKMGEARQSQRAMHITPSAPPPEYTPPSAPLAPFGDKTAEGYMPGINACPPPVTPSAPALPVQVTI
jgi:hypothetical protein